MMFLISISNSRHLKEIRSAVSDDPDAEKKKLNMMVLQEMFGDEKLAFSQNYILYAFSVIARTLIEACFIYLQVRYLILTS